MLDHRIRAAEARLFDDLRIDVRASFATLPGSGLSLRCLAHGSGPPLLLLHGVTMTAAAWAPLLAALPGYRLLAVDLPGHGLSDPLLFRRGEAREQAVDVVEELLDSLGLERATVVGHSLGAMFALWHAATSRRIEALVAVGDPAVALPGARVRAPLSLLTVPGVGRALLRSPGPPFLYRRLLAGGLGRADAAAAPEPLVEALRLSVRRPGNARSVASLMRAVAGYRRARPESVLARHELEALRLRTTFVWGADDPYLSPSAARPSIARMRSAALRVVPGAHAPWLGDAAAVAAQARSSL